MTGRKAAGPSPGRLGDQLRRSLLAPGFRFAAGITAALCALLTAFLGAEVAHQATPGWLDSAVDDELQASLAGRTAVLSALARLGDPVLVIVMAAAVFLACLATRRVRGALIIALSLPIAGAAELLLKPLIDRTRFGWQSFPSGHTIGVFALAVAMSVLLLGPLRPPMPVMIRALLASAALAVACAVAISLIVLGKHYFTDTVGGAAVATSVVLVTALGIDGFADRRKS